jgi:LPXTG-motif cell wall-anchored protein
LWNATICAPPFDGYARKNASTSAASLLAASVVTEKMRLPRSNASAGGGALAREILALALEHRIVSEFTSLVAVDVTPVRPDAEPLASLLPAQSGMLPRGGTTSRAQVLGGALLLGVAFWWLRRRK